MKKANTTQVDLAIRKLNIQIKEMSEQAAGLVSRGFPEIASTLVPSITALTTQVGLLNHERSEIIRRTFYR